MKLIAFKTDDSLWEIRDPQKRNWIICEGLTEEYAKLFAHAPVLQDEVASLRVELSEKTGELARLRASNKALVKSLIHISEYWNGDKNENAMFDACKKVVKIANAAIAAAEGEENE